MKTRRFLYAAAVAALAMNLTACSNTDEADGWKVEDDPTVTTLKATIGGASNTRISMEDGTDDGIDCKWETNDKIRILYYDNPSGKGTEQVYILTEGVGQQTGTFATTDASPSKDCNFIAFYPDGGGEAEIAGNTRYFNNAQYSNFRALAPAHMQNGASTANLTQSSTAPLAHIKPYHCLGGVGTITDGELSNVTFQPMMSVISFNITVSGGSITPKNVFLKPETDKGYDVIAAVVWQNKNGVLFLGDKAGSYGVCIEMSGYSSTSTFTTNFILPAYNCSDKSYKLEVTDDAGNTYTSEAFSGMDFIGGKRYLKDITVSQ